MRRGRGVGILFYLFEILFDFYPQTLFFLFSFIGILSGFWVFLPFMLILLLILPCEQYSVFHFFTSALDHK